MQLTGLRSLTISTDDLHLGLDAIDRALSALDQRAGT
jgi:hypothetical protein